MRRTASTWILILDFGSQYTQLIARRVRELQVYCEIHPFNADLSAFADAPPGGVILSGGPMSVNEPGAPHLQTGIFEWNVPVLGICYGLQLLAHTAVPGSVEKAARREFGRARLNIDDRSDLFKGFDSTCVVWMSHGDHLIAPPPGYSIIAHTANAPIAAVRHEHKPIFGVQFHPEVVHTENGALLLRNFVLGICRQPQSWTPGSFIQNQIADIRARVGTDKVICGLSGGVDSTVTAVLIHQAIGDRLRCVFVNNGLLRKNEYQDVLKLYRDGLNLPVVGVDATDRFMSALAGVTDPETKRKRIGKVFIDVFEHEIREHPEYTFLAQGTLYPDVIESVSFKGPSATIKSHHNVGGLPADMRLSLLEPMRELFKDEVRAVGRTLGIPEHFIGRHPFPGPGLAIRVLTDITPERLDILREVDHIFISELKNHGLYDQVWQAFAVLLPVHSVGVMGDERTYEMTAALRAVTSVDGMTADWAHLPHDFLAHVSNRISNEVRGVNRVVYDISSKPPATIEWE